jgi:hypothetical protein
MITCKERVTLTASYNFFISNDSPTVSVGSVDSNKAACTEE